jgi:hypothetical protein
MPEEPKSHSRVSVQIPQAQPQPMSRWRSVASLRSQRIANKGICPEPRHLRVRRLSLVRRVHHASAVASAGRHQVSEASSRSSLDSGVRSPETRSQGAPRKEKVMKRTLSIAFLAVAGLFASGNVSAQDRAVQATIPFDFSVSNTVLPSGTYIVSSESSQLVLIRNKDHAKLAAMAMANQGDFRYSGQGKLVFNRYGDEYFLSEIRCPYGAINADLPTSKREKKAKTREEASLQQPEQVIVAMQ